MGTGSRWSMMSVAVAVAGVFVLAAVCKWAGSLLVPDAREVRNEVALGLYFAAFAGGYLVRTSGRGLLPLKEGREPGYRLSVAVAGIVVGLELAQYVWLTAIRAWWPPERGWQPFTRSTPVLLPVLGVAAPLWEETLYRGMVLPWLIRLGS